MERGLQTLSQMQGFRMAWLKQDWIAQGWHEFICEEFVFAYEVCFDEATGEHFVWIRDVVHGSLYHYHFPTFYFCIRAFVIKR